MFLSYYQSLTKFLTTSFFQHFSVHSVQLTPEVRNRRRTPSPSASETSRYLSPCRTDRPSYFPRDPTNNREDLWGTKSHCAGTCWENAGTCGFPPCGRRYAR